MRGCFLQLLNQIYYKQNDERTKQKTYERMKGKGMRAGGG